MPEQPVRIPAGRHELEGAYESGAGSEGVVLCHPHPLYGGNMDNNVVMTLKKSLGSQGWATLRFNFRGVGASGGTHGDGRGEVDDLLAAAAYLKQQGPDRIHLAGYSYGAWIALRVCGQSLSPSTLLLVSPPIDFLDFTDLKLPQVPTLVTLGDADSFCSASALQEWLRTPGSELEHVRIEILEGCDHFYWGHEARLASVTRDFVRSLADDPH